MNFLFLQLNRLNSKSSQTFRFVRYETVICLGFTVTQWGPFQLRREFVPPVNCVGSVDPRVRLPCWR